MKKLTVKDLVDKFHFEILAGKKGLGTELESDDLHRPGLEFTGYLNYFPRERIQILGKQEITYLHSLPSKEREKRVKEVVDQKPPCFIITRNLQGLENLTKYCNKEKIPLLRTKEKTTRVMGRLNNFIEKSLAKEEGIHAVCMSIFGVGVIIRGESGIGKSEVALSLIERSHRLISDDVVILKKIDADTLIGTHNENNKHFLALRGVGLVNVLRIYGTGAFQDETKIDLDILLSPWKEEEYYDAMGIEKHTIEYLENKIDHIEIPIRPGRDIAALIEVAVKNWRLQEHGYEALKDFEKRLDEEAKI